MKSFTILVLSLFIFCSRSTAQFSENTDLGFFAGTAYYLGDVNQSFHFDHPSISIGGIIRKNLNERYAIRTSLKYAKLSGADADFDNEFKQFRNQSFSTTVFDFSLAGEFNFFPYGEQSRKNKFTPYAVLGVGASYFLTPANDFAALTIPFGLGVKFDVNERLHLAVEWLPHRTFTDDIEGFTDAFFGSGTSVNGKSISNKQIYFSSDDDWMYSVGVYVTFKVFGKQSSCSAYRFHAR